MSQLITLRGRSALSAFRRQKLLQTIATRIRGIRLDAEYWHFVTARDALAETERQRLERVLTYGPRGTPSITGGALMLVVPRLGTISPWSSKATDIARHCGVEQIERIERGVAYWIDGKLSVAHKAALAPVIHDRMTETVLESFDAAARLFQHIRPQPLATVDITHGGAVALERANREMGLALSADEIAYLAEHFGRI